MPFPLTEEHYRAANRIRRTILHYDARTVATECGGLKAPEGMSLLEAYSQRLWEYVDRVIGQLDSIHWDACFSDQVAFCHSSSLPKDNAPVFQQLWEEGVDLYQEYIAGCRKRGLECVLSHRISGPDVGNVDTLKLTHPEYYLKDWTLLSNFAVPAMRQHKLDMLRDIMQLYDFDGYEIDFCRHTPFLEPERQWELREHVTAFLRELRKITLEAEANWGHPILLSARVPECAEGCRKDGLDLAIWAEEQLVDTLTIGSRGFEVDIESIRKATKSAIKLFPCFDAHHQTDAYADPPAEVLRAVFANWWAQGADGIVMFNLYACSWETYRKTAAQSFREHAHALEQILPVAGDEALLAFLDKTYVVERRGGYPWQNGYANTNGDRQLPRVLPNNHATVDISLTVWDPVAHRASRIETLELSLVLYGLLPDDGVDIALNGVPIQGAMDRRWKDPQLRPLEKELVSGYHTEHLPSPEALSPADGAIDNTALLARVVCQIEPGQVVRGRNIVRIALRRGARYPNLAVAELEKIELAVRYRPSLD